MVKWNVLDVIESIQWNVLDVLDGNKMIFLDAWHPLENVRAYFRTMGGFYVKGRERIRRGVSLDK